MAAKQLTPQELERIQTYLASMKELEATEPEYSPFDTSSADAWEAWNNKGVELTREYSDVIRKALVFSLGDMGDTAPQSVAAILEAIIAGGAALHPEQIRATITEKLLDATYLPMLNGALTSDLMLFTKKGAETDRYTKTATFTTKEGRKITVENFDKLGPMSISVNKLLHTAIMYLTSSNYYKERREAITATVEIPLIEYGIANKKQLIPRIMDTPEEQEAENRLVDDRIKELKRSIRRDLTDLESVKWSGVETKGPAAGDYRNMRIVSSHSIHRINDSPYIRINFDVEFAAYIVNSPIMQYPIMLLGHDNRNPTAYTVGYKIALHNSIDRNNNIGTESTLSVKALLAAAPDIQSYDAIIARGARNWKDKIKRPLEKALDDNIAIGLISKWEYRDPKTGHTYTAAAAQPLTWPQYNRLMVDFSVIDAPDQTARREARAAEKALAAAAAAARKTTKRKPGRPRKKK